MDWNRDLNIYNFPVFSFPKFTFLKAEINLQFTAENLDEN